jgi:hypothetical protein
MELIKTGDFYLKFIFRAFILLCSVTSVKVIRPVNSRIYEFTVLSSLKSSQLPVFTFKALTFEEYKFTIQLG